MTTQPHSRQPFFRIPPPLPLAALRSRPYRVPHERFAVLTEDGETIRGVHLKRDQDTVVIYAHGFMSSKNLKAVPGFVEALSERFDTVAFDFRGHGESTGHCTFTDREVLDLEAVIRRFRPAYDHVILMGSSMGGATTIRYAGLYGGVDGVVTVGAFADYTRFLNPMTQRSLYLAFNHPVGPMYTRVMRNTRIGPLPLVNHQPLDVVGRIDPPILFIHGEWDLLIHPNEARLLHDHARDPKEIRIVPRAGHDMSILNRRTRDLIYAWAKRAVKIKN